MDGFGIGIDYVADIDECRVVEGEVIVFDFGLVAGEVIFQRANLSFTGRVDSDQLNWLCERFSRNRIRANTFASLLRSIIFGCVRPSRRMRLPLTASSTLISSGGTYMPLRAAQTMFSRT